MSPSLSSQAKIADFGLLRQMDSSSSQMNITAVVGTPGCMDPAYVQSHYATPSADVYRYVIESDRKTQHEEWDRIVIHVLFLLLAYPCAACSLMQCLMQDVSLSDRA